MSHTFCSRQTKTMWATLLTHRHSSKGWSLANSKSQGVGKYTQRTDTLSDTEIQTSRHYYRMQVVVSPGDQTISLLGRFLFLSSSPPATRTLPTTPAPINSQVEENGTRWRKNCTRWRKNGSRWKKNGGLGYLIPPIHTTKLPIAFLSQTTNTPGATASKTTVDLLHS